MQQQKLHERIKAQVWYFGPVAVLLIVIGVYDWARQMPASFIQHVGQR